MARRKKGEPNLTQELDATKLARLLSGSRKAEAPFVKRSGLGCDYCYYTILPDFSSSARSASRLRHSHKSHVPVVKTSNITVNIANINNSRAKVMDMLPPSFSRMLIYWVPSKVCARVSSKINYLFWAGRLRRLTATKLAGRYTKPKIVIVFNVLASFFAFIASSRAKAASSAVVWLLAWRVSSALASRMLRTYFRCELSYVHSSWGSKLTSTELPSSLRSKFSAWHFQSLVCVDKVKMLDWAAFPSVPPFWVGLMAVNKLVKVDSFSNILRFRSSMCDTWVTVSCKSRIRCESEKCTSKPRLSVFLGPLARTAFLLCLYS